MVVSIKYGGRDYEVYYKLANTPTGIEITDVDFEGVNIYGILIDYAKVTVLADIEIETVNEINSEI